MIHKVNLKVCYSEYLCTILYQHPIFTVSTDTECTVLLKKIKLTQEKGNVYVKKQVVSFTDK